MHDRVELTSYAIRRGLVEPQQLSSKFRLPPARLIDSCFARQDPLVGAPLDRPRVDAEVRSAGSWSFPDRHRLGEAARADHVDQTGPVRSPVRGIPGLLVARLEDEDRLIGRDVADGRLEDEQLAGYRPQPEEQRDHVLDVVEDARAEDDIELVELEPLLGEHVQLQELEAEALDVAAQLVGGDRDR